MTCFRWIMNWNVNNVIRGLEFKIIYWETSIITVFVLRIHPPVGNIFLNSTTCKMQLKLMWLVCRYLIINQSYVRITFFVVIMVLDLKLKELIIYIFFNSFSGEHEPSTTNLHHPQWQQTKGHVTVYGDSVPALCTVKTVIARKVWSLNQRV